MSKCLECSYLRFGACLEPGANETNPDRCEAFRAAARCFKCGMPVPGTFADSEHSPFCGHCLATARVPNIDRINACLAASGAWAKLSEADLSEAKLTRVNLSEANLTWANLTWANLTMAKLSGANLSGANLTEADLSWADLSWANLSGTDLSGTKLSEANLSGAKLSGAKSNDRPILAIIQCSGIGSARRMTTAVVFARETEIRCGCFAGSLAEFVAQIEQAHKDSPRYLAEYRATVRWIKSCAAAARKEAKNG